MKIRKKPIWITLISLVLCVSMVVAVTHRSSIVAFAVSQTSDNGYTFDDKDKVHVVGWHGDWDQYNKPWVMAADAWWNDSVYTYDKTAGRWKTDDYMRWQNGDGLEHHFVAWWPENIIKSNENLTAVNVTVTGDYNKDDILLAHWSGTRPENNQLNMEFKHLLSRFDVHLIFRDEYAGAKDISIQTHLKKTAECNFLTGEVTATSGEGIKMQQRPYPDANYDWSGTCITVPHNFPMSEQLLTIRFTVNGVDKAISYTHSQDLNFHSGERITLNLYVGKDKVELIDVSVNGWEQEDIHAGEAEESFADVSTTNTMTTISPYADSTPIQLYYTVAEQLKRPSFSGNLTVTGELTGDQLKMLNQAIMDRYDDDERLNALWLPDMTTLPDEAFMNNDNINILGFPKVSEIGNRAFYNCSGLSFISFGSPVTKVGTDAFSDTAQMRILVSSDQKQLTGDNTNGWITETSAVQTGENAIFCGYTFAEIANQ